MLEAKIKEYEKESAMIKNSINRLYKSFRERFNISINLYDEIEIIDSIEKHLYKLNSRDSGDSINSGNAIKYETEIADLKKKLVLALQGISDDNNSVFKTLEKDKNSKVSLYESLIIHLKNINLKHLLEIYYLNLQREEEIRSILEKKGINVDYNIKKNINELNTNYSNLKKLCDKNFSEYEQRSKMYILPEV